MSRARLALWLAAAAMVGGCQRDAPAAAAPAATASSAFVGEQFRPASAADLYQCEGCEGALEADAATMPATARIGPGIDRGEALRIEGVVYETDRRTPAPGVMVYAYHTNAAGRYDNGSPQTEASRRHGRLRGWVKTGADGRYSFTTIKPAPYPRDTIPAHVHLTVLEPGDRPYWIDDIVFDGEFGVTAAYRAQATNKGGPGIVRLTRGADGVTVARRDIILERHPT